MQTQLDLGHEVCRKKVCILCYRKGSNNIGPSDIETIKAHVIDGYDVTNSNFPAGMCNGCQLLLSKKRNNQDIILPLVDDYNPNRPTNLRSVLTCTCRICTVAKMKLQNAVRLKKKPGRPTTTTVSADKQVFKVCSNCFAKIYRGCDHSANSCEHSRRSKVYNLEKLLDSPKGVTKQRIASRAINSQPSTSLSTLGNTPKDISTPKCKKQLFSPDDICSIQLVYG